MLIRAVALSTLVAAAFVAANSAPAEVPRGIAPRPAPAAIAGSPMLAVVPGTFVFQVPGGDAGVFVYAGRYFRFSEGAWAVGPAGAGPWARVATDRVPRSVLAVPGVAQSETTIAIAAVPVAPLPLHAARTDEIGVLTHP